MSDAPAWRPTTAFVVAATVGCALLLLAGATRRPALVLVAAPLLTEVAWSLARGPRPGLRLAVRAGVTRAREGDDVAVSVDVHAADDADAVLTALEPRPLLGPLAPLRPTLDLPAEASRTLRARAVHWGRAPTAQAVAVAWAGHGLLRLDPVAVTGATLTVEPAALRVALRGPRPRTGVVGPRPSRRTGAGGDLTGVRGFAAGDRLRHVHWRVTARRGDLHVTTTTADHEAALLLAVDTGTAFSPTDDPTGGATTLDLAVRTAASLARVHLRAGDRVGVVDLGDPTRVLRPGTGHRHLDRVVDRLVQARRTAPADLRRLPEIVARTAPGAHVVVVSPLLRPAVGDGVARLAQSGVQVAVVDVLDPDLDRRRLPAAPRLLLLERDATVDRLTAVGVEVRP